MTTVHSHKACLGADREPEREGAELPLPLWVDAALRESALTYGGASVSVLNGAGVRVVEAGGLALCTAIVESAAAMPTAGLRESVALAYRAVFEAAAGLEARHPVRMWSFIPHIHAARGEGLSTYHVFNVGRFEAFAGLAGGRELSFVVPTATGVGHTGRDLMIHCLSAARPGRHVENPRQVPAYRYSARYGPRPPCFARATILEKGGGRVLLVGGTASVRSEHSMHEGDLQAQLAETFANLEALTASAGSGGWEFGSFGHVRAYVPRVEHHAAVRDEVRRRLGEEATLEVVRADLCREELMVEIEAIGEMRERP